jgi:hypothetical protein
MPASPEPWILNSPHAPFGSMQTESITCHLARAHYEGGARKGESIHVTVLRQSEN